MNSSSCVINRGDKSMTTATTIAPIHDFNVLADVENDWLVVGL